ncbi:putative membrane protein [Wickerhamomyces ciferrii]|uniref:Membrane protein n=1 Tax=Wickerhamomyces ciferrii (strain ATCC 14091 / BCRC 22168 / CBS 111 / JCM 3599 / NBRC 0793 / NRRL Y-1031 F-60-10) TaxID=1206466 RepID=K0KLC1_WICCF|nr:uncharacterized protein BN7_1452 [Wickerhamomyces ciferrii]CCH41913.1 putative membrane protein [Wickerhamomyces ciferrii]
MWTPNKIFSRERNQPGSLWSLLMSLATFILLCCAIGGLCSKIYTIKNVYIAELEFKNAKWNNILPSSYSNSNTENGFGGSISLRRLNHWNNMRGVPNQNAEFSALNRYTVGYKHSMSCKYVIYKDLVDGGESGSNFKEDDIRLPKGAQISRINRNAILFLTLFACIFNGIGVLAQLLKVPFHFVPKIAAIFFLFIANIMVHVLAKRMANSFNNNYSDYGIGADLGTRYLTMVWFAFGFLIASVAFDHGDPRVARHSKDSQPTYNPEVDRNKMENTGYGHDNDGFNEGGSDRTAFDNNGGHNTGYGNVYNQYNAPPNPPAYNV